MNKEHRLRLKKELEKKLLEECRLKEEAEAKKMEAEQEELEIIKKMQIIAQIYKNIIEQIEKLNIDSVIKGDYGFLGDNKSIRSDNQNNKSNSKSNNDKCLSKNNNSNINKNAQSNQIICLSSNK